MTEPSGQSLGDLHTQMNGLHARTGPECLPGRTIGEYHILRLLGRGGMGEVYEAENVVSRKRIALKVLPRAATGGGRS